MEHKFSVAKVVTTEKARFTVEFDRPLNEDVQMEPHRLPRGALARPPPGPFPLRN